MRIGRKFPRKTRSNICLVDQIPPKPTAMAGLSGKIKDIKIPEENPPLTPLSERLDMNLGEKYKICCFNTQAVRSTFQDLNSCAKGLLIDDFRSTKIWRIIVC